MRQFFQISQIFWVLVLTSASAEPFPDRSENVVVTEMVLLVDGKTLKTINFLQASGDHNMVVKEGSEFNIKIVYYVQREIVAGLRLNNVISRKGITVDKSTYVIGSYGPKVRKGVVFSYSYITPTQEFPVGMIKRGHYVVKSKITDDDKNLIKEWSWSFDVKKDWE